MLVHFGEHSCKEDGHFVIAFPHEESLTPPFQKIRFGKPRFQSCEERQVTSKPLTWRRGQAVQLSSDENLREKSGNTIFFFFFFKEGGASHLNPNNVLSHLIQYQF